MEDNVSWRPVFAALAHEATRRMWAQLVLGADPAEAGGDLSPSRRRHAREALQAAGMLDDQLAPDPTVFARVLSSTPRAERPTGVDRFLTREGRIDRFPSRPADREELLTHVLERTLAVDEELTESEWGERLSRFSEDTAMLRRHLVDAGLVSRTPSGSRYSRPAGS